MLGGSGNFSDVHADAQQFENNMFFLIGQRLFDCWFLVRLGQLSRWLDCPRIAKVDDIIQQRTTAVRTIMVYESAVAVTKNLVAVA